MSIAAAAPGTRNWTAARRFSYFRVARLDAVICVSVTGLVHYAPGSLVFGPRPRITPRVDANDHGHRRVLLNCVGVAVLFLVYGFLAMLVDRRLSATPWLVEG